MVGIERFPPKLWRKLQCWHYAPLPAILKSFDRALADEYSEARQIAMGMHGQRIVNLATDHAFLETLPLGAETEIKGFAAAIATFINRFPDWVAYVSEGQVKAPVASQVREELSAFAQIDQAIAQSPHADDAVKAEIHDATTVGTAPTASEVEAKGLLDSIVETARTLAESALADAKTGQSAKHFAVQMRRTGETELPKFAYWTVGWTLDLLGRSNPALRRLAMRFPTRMGFIVKVLDYLGLDDDTSPIRPEVTNVRPKA